ncbi:MAG: hypothetical protein IH786_03510 [Proteobacteria bacterium]|nr:hypothetical protein [Pseudomonadota bacterium]
MACRPAIVAGQARQNSGAAVADMPIVVMSRCTVSANSLSPASAVIWSCHRSR